MHHNRQHLYTVVKRECDRSVNSQTSVALLLCIPTLVTGRMLHRQNRYRGQQNRDDIVLVSSIHKSREEITRRGWLD